MKIIKEINKEKVLQTYLRSNNNIKGQDYNLIKRVLKKNKRIYLINLNLKEIGSIIMPHHFLCNCNNHLNLKGIVWKNFAGLSLKKVILKILLDKQYSTKYPTCWNKIQIQKRLFYKEKQRTIILARGKPLFFHLSYFGLKNKKNELYLIDGTHRLIALMLMKKIPKNLKVVLIG